MSARPQEDPRPDHPYLDWAVDTGFAFQRPGNWIPLIVEFQPNALPVRERKARSLAEQFSWLCAEGGPWHPWACVPPLFIQLANSLRGLRNQPLAVLLVERDNLRRVLEHPDWRSTVLRAELGPPLTLPTNPNLKPIDLPLLSYDAPDKQVRRAVIGIIDQGIAFAHARFRNADGSRIAYLWQQEVITDLPQTTLGKEITAADINAAVAAAHGDEDWIYRTRGGLRYSEDGYKPLARHRTHGTQVLDLAAGAPMINDVKDRPIIAVDMPEQAIGDPAGSTLTTHALLGLFYIVLRANSMCRDDETLPIVVNISYGPHEGPHDGSSLFERYADLLVELLKGTRTPLQIVLAAGNFRQSRVHSAFRLGAAAKQSLRWRLQPCGRTPSAMELWWPAGAQLAVTLTPPRGTPISVSDAPASRKARHTEVGRLVYSADYDTPPASNLSRVVLIVAPTELSPRVADGHAVAPSGEWTVEVHNESGSAVDVKAWIKRSDTPYGRGAKGRQSYFEDAAYVRSASSTHPVDRDPPGSQAIVQRRSTLSGIATGGNTVVVGGYRLSDDAPAPYSSAGPHGNPGRPTSLPSILAPSERSAVRRGVMAAGTRSGSMARIVGTSAAAPQVTAWIADEWVKNDELPKLTFPPLKKPKDDDPDFGSPVLLPARAD